MNGIGFKVRRPNVLMARIEARSIPEPNTGCWLWCGTAVAAGGYGVISCDGRATGAHRACLACIVGGIKDGEKALHRCDTPSCVNPDHLYLGSSADNYADMIAKGRARHLEPSKRPRIPRDIALAVLQDERSGHIIAEELGVSYRTVCNLKSGRTFSRDTGKMAPRKFYL